MSDSDGRKILVLVSADDSYRGAATSIEYLSATELKTEVENFVRELGGIFATVSGIVPGPARLSEVTLSASIQAGGKLSLLGSGVETSADAGISFKFCFPD